MEDLDLLLSVAGGLGRWQYPDGVHRVYVKDEDCLGKSVLLCKLQGPTAWEGQERTCTSCSIMRAVLLVQRYSINHCMHAPSA